MTLSPSIHRAHRPAGFGAAAALVLALSGCATFSDDGGFTSVESETRNALDLQSRWLKSEQDQQTARAEVTKLLAADLSAETAM